MAPTAALVAFADALAEADDRDRLVRVLAVLSRALLAVSAVSVLLADEDGALVGEGAPDQPGFARLFDLQPRFGPACDCYHYGRSVAITLSGAHCLGWPTFGAAMSDVGVAVADAMPLRVRDRTVGVLTVFRTEINPGAAERRFGGLVQGLANLWVGNLPTEPPSSDSARHVRIA
jgi:hypothetical protein